MQNSNNQYFDSVKDLSSNSDEDITLVSDELKDSDVFLILLWKKPM